MHRGNLTDVVTAEERNCGHWTNCCQTAWILNLICTTAEAERSEIHKHVFEQQRGLKPSQHFTRLVNPNCVKTVRTTREKAKNKTFVKHQVWPTCSKQLKEQNLPNSLTWWYSQHGLQRCRHVSRIKRHLHKIVVVFDNVCVGQFQPQCVIVLVSHTWWLSVQEDIVKSWTECVYAVSLQSILKFTVSRCGTIRAKMTTDDVVDLFGELRKTVTTVIFLPTWLFWIN